jgi:hypothetical protein
MAEVELSPNEDTREDFEKIISALWEEAKARDWENEYKSIMKKAGLEQYITTKCVLSATVKFRVPVSMMGKAGEALGAIFEPEFNEHVTRHITINHPPREGAGEGMCVCPEDEAQALAWVKAHVKKMFDEYPWEPAGERITGVDLVTRIEYKCPSSTCTN